MEDLVPLIFFLVIILVNGFKYLVERSARKRARDQLDQPGGQPQREQSPFDKFLEDLAEQMAPKPAPVPDWPEGRKRPDYMREMENFERSQVDDWIMEEEEVEEPAAMPVAETQSTPVVMRKVERASASQRTKATIQSPLQASKALLTDSWEIRMPGFNPFPRTGDTRDTDFSLKEKGDLKQAMMAHIVFSAPRALDRSFDNTIAK